MGLRELEVFWGEDDHERMVPKRDEAGQCGGRSWSDTVGKGPRGFLQARWPGAAPACGRTGVRLMSQGERREEACWIRVVWNTLCVCWGDEGEGATAVEHQWSERTYQA